MSGSLTHVLFEGPSGYALFTVNMQEEIGAKTKQMQDTVNDLNIFNRMVQLASFLPFTSAVVTWSWCCPATGTDRRQSPDFES